MSVERKTLYVVLAAFVATVIAAIGPALNLVGINPHGALSWILGPWLAWLPVAPFAIAGAFLATRWHIRGLRHLSKLEKENAAKAKSDAETLQAKLDDAQVQIAWAEAKRRDAQEEAVRLRSQVELAQEEQKRVGKEAARGKVDLVRINLNLDKAEEELATTREELEQAREQATLAEGAAARLRAELARSQGRAAQAESRRDAPANKYANLRILELLHSWQADYKYGRSDDIVDERAFRLIAQLTDSGELAAFEPHAYKKPAFAKHLAKAIAAEQARLGVLPPKPAPL